MSTLIWQNNQFIKLPEKELTTDETIAILERSLHTEKPYGSIKDTKETKSFIYDEDGYVIGHKLTKII